MATYLLGVRIDTETKEGIMAKIRSFFTTPGGHIITTPNPEILVTAHEDTVYAAVLNAAELNVCDGRGIQLLAKEKVTRFPGVDLLQALLKETETQGKRVFLLGTGDTKILKKAEASIQAMCPKLSLCGTHPGVHFTYSTSDGLRTRDTSTEERMIDMIIDTAPDVLVVAFSHRKQELWISEHLGEFPSVKIAIGVGGSLDMIAGKTPRAPAWMRRAGIEWLWRLLLQPKRIKRIVTAVFIFPLLVFKERITS